MATQTFEVEADSIDEARKAVAFQIPAGSRVFSEKVVQSNDPVTLRGKGEDPDAAYAKAMADVPEDAEVIDRKDIAVGQRKLIGVEAFTEQEARQGVTGDVIVGDAKLTIAGSKGFLGIGKKPNHYDVEVLSPAVVEIRYKRPLKMAFRAGDPNDEQREQALGLAEAIAGGWPSELDRETFDDFDFDGFFAWVREFGSKAHPGTLPGFGSKPTYRIVGGQIAREANPPEDCMIASTASRLAGRGTVSPFDDRACSYTFEMIQLYGGWNLAKFIFLLPFADRFAGKDGGKVILVEDAVIEVYKCVENMLFEIYDDLREGQSFHDETVRRKLVSYVQRFARGDNLHGFGIDRKTGARGE